MNIQMKIICNTIRKGKEENEKNAVEEESIDRNIVHGGRDEQRNAVKSGRNREGDTGKVFRMWGDGV